MESGSEDNLLGDPKFQRFASSIDRALKGFEVTREWHDLISCLARLHKVLYFMLTHYLINKSLSLLVGSLGLFSLHGRAVQSPVVQEAVTVPPSQPTWWSTSQSNRCLQVRFSPISLYNLSVCLSTFPPSSLPSHCISIISL